ncbi:MAG: IS200/IS605 family transposase [Fibrobacteres bacterium]|nr:IS200/IS605 family transposase [Fibrobacterota bacterium]
MPTQPCRPQAAELCEHFNASYMRRICRIVERLLESHSMSSDIRLYVHAWFHSKNNQPWISPEIEIRLLPYIGGIAKDLGSHLVQAGCSSDHVHLLIQLSPQSSLEDLMRRIKGATSRWIGLTFPCLGGSIWQHGYGATSVSPGSVETTVQYIKTQRIHHGT